MPEKTKLNGGPEKTATWIWLEQDRLHVEFYDFSEAAQTFFGNDIAWTITVNDMEKLLSIVNQDEKTLLAWIQGYFKSFFGIRQWLEENGIEFVVQRESWA